MRPSSAPRWSRALRDRVAAALDDDDDPAPPWTGGAGAGGSGSGPAQLPVVEYGVTVPRAKA
jgi:hypothetical protein